MHAARRQVESTSPTRGRINSSASDGLEPLIESLEQQLVSSRRPSSGELRDSKRLPDRNLSALKTASQTEPAAPDGMDQSWTIEQLRATLIARAQKEEKRGFRLPRLT